jgi:hypothetical protein
VAGEFQVRVECSGDEAMEVSKFRSENTSFQCLDVVLYNVKIL